MGMLVKLITGGVIILFLVLSQRQITALLKYEEIDTSSILAHAGILLLFVAILLLSYLFSTIRYKIQDGRLIINRPIGNIKINSRDITEIRKIKNRIFTLRTFGSGGLFGFYGKFYNSKYGNMTWYVTQRKNLILLTTKNGKKIMISPDDVGLADKLEELRRI